MRLTEIKDCEVYSSDGEKIGKVDEIFVDDETSEPEWVTLGTGIFGAGKRFVPLDGASMTGAGMRVPFTKEYVKDAPDVDVDEGYLDDSAEMQLYEYYGLRRGFAELGDAPARQLRDRDDDQRRGSSPPLPEVGRLSGRRPLSSCPRGR